MPRGGKREGAGRTASPDSKTEPVSARVTPEVGEYLQARGTGRIEGAIRRSKDFREWRVARKSVTRPQD